MFSFLKKEKKRAPTFFTNTLSGKKELFVPLQNGRATQYSCGPTVYGAQHIGNLRAAVFADSVARALKEGGYAVRRVINITDVGHLVGDGDEGEDKMAVGARNEKTTPEAIAKRYTERYLQDIKALNLDTHDIHFPRASEYIKEQISMIQVLEKKGLAYSTDDGVYYDTGLFQGYGKLGNQRDVEQQAGARVAVAKGKKNPRDFALWRFAGPNDLQKWESPWGEGNPGWSIECSAMARALLGDTIDIHTGGQDHIAVHHNNEIAQSEGSTEKPLARYWMHNAFLTIEGAKISKSVGNVHTLSDVTERGFHPLALRYFFLQAHYRTPLSFSWDALAGADEALKRLWKTARDIKKDSKRGRSSDASERLRSVFLDDLATPQALSLLWDSFKDEQLSPAERTGVLEEAESLLGLSLTNPPEAPEELSLEDLPAEVRAIAVKRENARAMKDFAKADELRIHFEKRGYAVEDTASGTIYIKKQG